MVGHHATAGPRRQPRRLAADAGHLKPEPRTPRRRPDQRPGCHRALPGARRERGEIFIDSKFPFDKFWKAATSDSPDQAHLHRTEHAADLLKHADALSKRGYHHKESSPDFVVLFAPFESILSVALEAEPQLLDKMFAKRVVIATPTTMLALLRTIGYGYSQRDMVENAARIRELAGVFLKRAVTVHGKLEVLGNRLRSTANAYSELVASAENSIFVPARRMVALGVPEPKALTALEADVPMREFQSRAELAGEGDDGFTDLDDQLALTTGDDQ
jgi:Uncharacterized protein conserved in bacteria